MTRCHWFVHGVPVYPPAVEPMGRRVHAEPLVESVRARIRTLRRDRGLTQEALGERAGISPEAVSRIEAGSRVPTLATLARLADGLEIDLVELIGSRPPSPPRRHPKSIEALVLLVEREPAYVQQTAVNVVRALTRSLRASRRRGKRD